MAAYAIFALSFIVRPFGGIFWGHIGDKFGRKNALSWSIILMTLSTLCIALLPGYQTRHICTVTFIVVPYDPRFLCVRRICRCFQFPCRICTKRKKGLYTSLVPASTAASLLLGSLMAAAMFAFMSEAFTIMAENPFLLAAPLGLIGRIGIRLKLEDTPEFLEHQKMESKKAFQSRHFSPYRTTLFKAFAVASLNATAFYLIFSVCRTICRLSWA